MNLLHTRSAALFLTALLLCSSIQGLFAQGKEVTYIADRHRMPDREWQAELRAQWPWQGFRTAHGAWVVEFDEYSAMPHKAFGPPIATVGESPEARALHFLTEQLADFRMPLEELVHIATFPLRNGHIVHFQQVHQGAKVHFALAKVRLDAQGRVSSFGVDLHPLLDIDTTPLLPEGQAVQSATEGLEGVVGSNVNGSLGILPIPGNRSYEHRLVYEVMVDTRTAGHEGRWLCWVDAEDGRLWYRQNMVVDHAMCSGSGAQAVVEATVRANGGLEPTTVELLPELRVLVDGEEYFTDALGEVITGQDGPVEATFRLEGAYAQVRTGGTVPSFTTVLDDGPNTISFDQDANIRERTAYLHVNRIHEHMKTVVPAFTGLDYPLPTNIDLTGGTCNAFYNGSSINFYAEGGGCYSLALYRDVVYHEYGHGINDKFYQDLGSAFINGAMNEGYADVWALSLTLEPVLAQGWQIGSPNSNIRRYDENPKRYPDDLVGQVHADGEIIAGAWWDTFLLLGDMELTLALFGDAFPGLQANTPNGQEGQAYRDVLIDVLLADDDDGDLTNGTPNALAIIEGFAMHGITLLSNVEIEHEALEAVPEEEAIVISAVVDLTFPANIYLGDVLLRYRVNEGQDWITVTMVESGSDEYTAEIPAQPEGTVISYYLAVEDIFGQLSSVLPIGSALPEPNLPNYLLVGFELAATEDMDDTNELGDFSVGLPGDNATTGIWELTVPVPSFSTVDQSMVQPGAPRTPGGELCFVTGNASGPNAGVGENDVDGGSTTIYSGPIDVSGLIDPTFTYWRWYTNNPPGGANPNADWWQVYISSNGTDWVPVEDTRVSDRSWRRKAFRVGDLVDASGTIQLRFHASDSIRPGTNLDGGSLVEAALDDIQLWGATTASSIDDAENVALSALYPSPANDHINVVLASGAPSDVTLEVVDPAGRIVEVVRTRTAGGLLPLRINVSRLSPGGYLLRATWPGGRSVKRFSVLR